MELNVMRLTISLNETSVAEQHCCIPLHLSMTTSMTLHCYSIRLDWGTQFLSLLLSVKRRKLGRLDDVMEIELAVQLDEGTTN